MSQIINEDLNEIEQVPPVVPTTVDATALGYYI